MGWGTEGVCGETGEGERGVNEMVCVCVCVCMTAWCMRCVKQDGGI